MSTVEKPIATPKKGRASSPEPRRGWFTVKMSDVDLSGVALSSASQKRGAASAVQRVTGAGSFDQRVMLKMVRYGLKFSSIGHLGNTLGASQRELCGLLSIPVSTLKRRRDEGRLRTDESDRVVRFAALKDKAVGLMQGDEGAALSWLRTPLAILGDETPLEHATTELGAREVEDLIGRLRHGVFS